MASTDDFEGMLRRIVDLKARLLGATRFVGRHRELMPELLRVLEDYEDIISCFEKSMQKCGDGNNDDCVLLRQTFASLRTRFQDFEDSITSNKAWRATRLTIALDVVKDSFLSFANTATTVAKYIWNNKKLTLSMAITVGVLLWFPNYYTSHTSFMNVHESLQDGTWTGMTQVTGQSIRIITELLMKPLCALVTDAGSGVLAIGAASLLLAWVMLEAICGFAPGAKMYGMTAVAKLNEMNQKIGSKHTVSTSELRALMKAREKYGAVDMAKKTATGMFGTGLLLILLIFAIIFFVVFRLCGVFACLGAEIGLKTAANVSDFGDNIATIVQAVLFGPKMSEEAKGDYREQVTRRAGLPSKEVPNESMPGQTEEPKEFLDWRDTIQRMFPIERQAIFDGWVDYLTSILGRKNALGGTNEQWTMVKYDSKKHDRLLKVEANRGSVFDVANTDAIDNEKLSEWLSGVSLSSTSYVPHPDKDFVFRPLRKELDSPLLGYLIGIVFFTMGTLSVKNLLRWLRGVDQNQAVEETANAILAGLGGISIDCDKDLYKEARDLSKAQVKIERALGKQTQDAHMREFATNRPRIKSVEHGLQMTPSESSTDTNMDTPSREDIKAMNNMDRRALLRELGKDATGTKVQLEKRLIEHFYHL